MVNRTIQKLATVGISWMSAALMPLDSFADSLNLTTWYPAPYGVYSQLRSTGNSYLAYQSGSVGIGTNTPGSRLDLDGAFTIRGMSQPAVSPAAQGRIYFDSALNKFQVSENGQPYRDLGGASPPFNNVQTYSANGTFVVPPGVSRLWVEVYGGGAGGAGSSSGDAYHRGGGGGGGAGGVAMGFADVAPGQSITVSVGAGGAAGAPGSRGGDGIASTFLTLRAAGGTGGFPAASENGIAEGGKSSGGAINQWGGAGGNAGGPNIGVSPGTSGYYGGIGGSTTRGGGGCGGGINQGGCAGGPFGGGGGGGGGSGVTGGGAGGSGAVVIWY